MVVDITFIVTPAKAGVQLSVAGRKKEAGFPRSRE
jgi:hypothetical protein